MVNIQILFLFTSKKNFSTIERENICTVVKEEYCKSYSIAQGLVETVLEDAYSEKETNDIVVAISGGMHIMNEGNAIGEMKRKISERLGDFPFMKKHGFSGSVGIHQGEVRKDEVNEIDKEDRKKEGDRELNQNDYKARAKMYTAQEPRYTMDMLQISDETMNAIDNALGRIQYEKEVFEEWGLYTIMPSPVSAMSFYGPPGTGKTLAAEAIASKLNKKIIRASYADIENKYVGEGPKNVEAIFIAAEEQDAVLFIDEADSLLSKRLVNVSDPSGQAMNSMRSQLLICLEKFHGIVIFATNLAVNYDKAFVSRLINIPFELPDAKMREKIWHAHLYSNDTSKVKLNIPLADDVNLTELAECAELCGREIRGAVVDACVSARIGGMSVVTQKQLMDAAINTKNRADQVAMVDDHTKITRETKEFLADAMNKSAKKSENQ